MLNCLEEPKQPPKQFTFDGAYGIDSTTETIYNDVGFTLVESVIIVFLKLAVDH
jgi:kinesin family protein 3/17